MEKFKIISKFKKGQTLWALYEGKVITGPCIGFSPAMVTPTDYYNNVEKYQIDLRNDKPWIGVKDCYTSKRALFKGIQS